MCPDSIFWEASPACSAARRQTGIDSAWPSPVDEGAGRRWMSVLSALLQSADACSSAAGAAAPRVAGTQPDLRPAHLPGALVHRPNSPRYARRAPPTAIDRVVERSSAPPIVATPWLTWPGSPGSAPAASNTAFRSSTGRRHALPAPGTAGPGPRRPGPSPRHGRRHRLALGLHQPRPLRPRLPRPLWPFPAATLEGRPAGPAFTTEPHTAETCFHGSPGRSSSRRREEEQTSRLVALQGARSPDPCLQRCRLSALISVFAGERACDVSASSRDSPLITTRSGTSRARPGGMAAAPQKGSELVCFASASPVEGKVDHVRLRDQHQSGR